MTKPNISDVQGVGTAGRHRGVVEKVDFTYGGAGNQWTTIDGEKFATWWDFRTADWKVGDEVTFEVYHRPLWSGMSSIPCAQNIRRAALSQATGGE